MTSPASSGGGYAEGMRKMTLREWRAERVEGRARARRLAAGFPQPYVRERPRDPEEARLLRERGTPQRLIGPTRAPGEDG